MVFNDDKYRLLVYYLKFDWKLLKELYRIVYIKDIFGKIFFNALTNIFINNGQKSKVSKKILINFKEKN